MSGEDLQTYSSSYSISCYEPLRFFTSLVRLARDGIVELGARFGVASWSAQLLGMRVDAKTKELGLDQAQFAPSTRD